MLAKTNRMGAQPSKPTGETMASNPLAGTKSASVAIQRVSYSHDSMIDHIIANPTMSQGEIAKAFGYTESWISRIFCSDAFQARLAERKGDVVDPTLVASVEERVKALAAQSMDVLSRKLEQSSNPDLALKVFEISSKAIGYGAREKNLGIQNNFVVHLPNKITDPHAWANAHNPNAGTEPAVVIEAETR